MNRREMAKVIGGAALTAASYRRVWGANDRVGIALIGSGRRGTIVMKAMLETKRADLRCICDVYDVHRNLARQTLAPRDPGIFECVAHEDALARPDVDAVLIAVPDHLHIEIASAALGAKKHVYLEKPTTHKFSEQQKLREACARSGRVLQCGMQQRSGEHYIRAKEEIFERNKLGKVVIVRTMWSDFPWQTRHLKPRPNLPASIGIAFSDPRQRFHSSGFVTTPGAISPIMATGWLPISSRTGPMSRNG